MIECYNNACPMHSVHNQKDPDKEPLCLEKLCVLDQVKLDPAKLAVCKAVESALGICGVSLDEFRRYMEVRQEQVYLVWGATDVRGVHTELSEDRDGGDHQEEFSAPLNDRDIRTILDSLWEEHNADEGVQWSSLLGTVAGYIKITRGLE